MSSRNGNPSWHAGNDDDARGNVRERNDPRWGAGPGHDPLVRGADAVHGSVDPWKGQRHDPLDGRVLLPVPVRRQRIQSRIQPRLESEPGLPRSLHPPESGVLPESWNLLARQPSIFSGVAWPQSDQPHVQPVVTRLLSGLTEVLPRFPRLFTSEPLLLASKPLLQPSQPGILSRLTHLLPDESRLFPDFPVLLPHFSLVFSSLPLVLPLLAELLPLQPLLLSVVPKLQPLVPQLFPIVPELLALVSKLQSIFSEL